MMNMRNLSDYMVLRKILAKAIISLPYSVS